MFQINIPNNKNSLKVDTYSRYMEETNQLK